MAIKYSNQDIISVQNKRIFFDANVLIYLFWASGSQRWENVYSNIFASLLRQRNELLVDFIVISEITNRAIRLEYDKHLRANNLKKDSLTFKTYRDSQDGQLALTDIHLIVETNILNRFTVIGKAFTKEEILSFLSISSLDFADKGILLTCKENSCILLTNDADYKNADIDILTANPAILRNI